MLDLIHVIVIGIKPLPASPQNSSRKKASVSPSKESHILHSPRVCFQNNIGEWVASFWCPGQGWGLEDILRRLTPSYGGRITGEHFFLRPNPGPSTLLQKTK